MRADVDGDEQGSGRTLEDYEELQDALEEARGFLEAGKTRDADVALKRAGVKAAAMWGGVGVPALPEPVRDLISLSAQAQDLLARADGSADTSPLLRRLGELHPVFEREAAREAGASPARTSR